MDQIDENAGMANHQTKDSQKASDCQTKTGKLALNHIAERQNEEKMLTLQCAARFKYNRAEYLYELLFVLNVAYVVVGVFGKSIGLQVALILCNFALSRIAKSWIEEAAGYRKLFDEYVLGSVKLQSLLDTHHKEFAKAEQLRIRNKQYFEKITHNTGEDKPRGVRNWYEDFQPEMDENTARYACQSENCEVDTELSKLKSIIIAIVGIVIFMTVTVVLYLMHSLSGSVYLIIVVGLASYIANRIWCHGQHYAANMKIRGALEIIGAKVESSDVEKLNRLQEMIDKKRNINATGLNFIHWWKMGELAEAMKKSRLA